MSAGTFTCEACGGTFAKGWSDEEARAEAEDLFGPIPADAGVAAVVCDACWEAIMAAAAAQGWPSRWEP